MPAGRPRTTSLSKDEMLALGKEMVDWVKSHPDTLHLSEWYTIEKMYTYNEWKVMKDKPEFHPYYEVALKLIAKKYIDGTVNSSIAQRWQRVYFKDVKEEEDLELQTKLDKELEQKKALIDHDIRAKKEALINVAVDIREQFDSWNNQLSNLQSSFNMANKTIKEESKS